MDPAEEFLEKVLLKFALTDDSDLEKVLANYLPPVLTHVSSEKTRNKAVEILSHINKRIKSQHQIKLPLLALLEQWKEPNLSAFQRNFVLLYLEMGIKRTSPEEQRIVISSLLSTLSSLSSQQQQDTILHMFLMTLRPAVLKLPLDKKKREEFFVFAKSKNESALLLDFLLDVLLFTLPPLSSENENVEYISPGLSLKAQKRIKSKMTFTSDTLIDTKEAVVEFLIDASSEVSHSNDILPHFIVASCDNYHSVASKGEDGLRRYLPRLDLEQKDVISKLMVMFQGTLQQKNLAPDEKRKPVSFTTRLKILEYFSRSQLAANFYPQNVQVLFEALFGTESNLRMKQTAMQFLHWILRIAEDVQLTSMGPLLLIALNKLLTAIHSSDNTDLNLRDLKGTTYQAIGVLAKRMPQLFGSNVQLLRDFFNALSREESNVRVFLSEALSNMCLAYQRALLMSPDFKFSAELESILSSASEKADAQSRFLAVYYSNRLFPFDHIPSRYLNLLTTHDSKSEVSAESRRGLRPYRRVDYDIVPDPSQSYPNFPQFIAYIASKTNERRKVSGKNALPFPPLVYKEILEFTRAVLKASAKEPTNTNEKEEKEKEKVSHHSTDENEFEEKKKVEKRVKEYVLSLGDPNAPESSLRHYRELLEDALSSYSTSELQHTAVECALELIAYQPATFSHYTSQNKLGPFRTLLFTARGETRNEVAKVIGLLSLQLSDTARVSLCNELINLVRNQRDNITKRDEVLGAISALGQILSRCIQRDVPVSENIILTTLEILSTLLTTTSTTDPHSTLQLQLAAVQSIGLVARFNPLPLNDEITKTRECPMTKTNIIQNIINLMKNTSETNVVECCVEALANISLSDRTPQLLSLIADALLLLYRLKQEEVHFAIGEALSIVMFSWMSTATSDLIAVFDDRDQRIVTSIETNTTRERDNETEKMIITNILKTILDDYLLSDRVDTRTAASIWLLAILKYSGTHPLIVSQLSKVQRVFSLLLADPNEIVQEVAAKGLVLVYERGDQTTKDTLVSELVKTLIHGQQGFKLTPDAPLAIEVPTVTSNSRDEKSKEGVGISTYRELAAFATEMNQPDLIYKFLNLSVHHSLWNSKRGAAFATQTLAAKAESQLKPHLSKLIPKLYRSQYDPNPKISQAMSRILKSLVDPKKVTQQYFEEIVRDLLENMWTTQWRTREAACLALSDLLVGQTADRVFPYLEELWIRVLKVMDDLKESVRIAAEHAFKSLSSLTVRLCDPTRTTVKFAQKAVDIAIPFLLKKGLSSDVAEVRKISLAQISQICKVANFLLKPHISELVSTLLESLSVLEPAELNYLSFHVEKMGIKQEDFEKLRLQISSLLPVNETLEICVSQIDTQNAADIVAKLTHLLSHGLGVATKVSTAQFIVHFALRKGNELKPFAPKLLHSLVPVLSSKSVSVRQAAARSFGVVAKLTTTQDLQSVLENLITLYQNADSDDALSTRLGVAEALLELTRTASSVVQPLHKLLIPTVFFACHDPNNEIKKIFTEIWNEMGVSLSLHHSLVVPLLLKSLESSSWIVKRQAALAMIQFIDSVSFTQLQLQHSHQLLRALLNALRGRVWNGKGTLLIALAHFVKNFYQLFVNLSKVSDSSSSDEVTPQELVVVVLTECQRKSREYKKEALTALCSILETFTLRNITTITTNTFDTSIRSNLTSIALGQDEKEMKESTESQSTQPANTTMLSIQEQTIRSLAFRALSLAVPKEDVERMTFVLDFYLQHFQQQEPLVKQELIRGLKVIMEKFAASTQLQKNWETLWNPQRVHSVTEIILSQLDTKVEGSHLAAFETLKTWIELKRPDKPDVRIVDNECSHLLQRLKEITTKYPSLSHGIEPFLQKLSKAIDEEKIEMFPNKKPKIEEQQTK